MIKGFIANRLDSGEKVDREKLTQMRIVCDIINLTCFFKHVDHSKIQSILSRHKEFFAVK
ncbi:MAG: hypothetical protein COX19_00140 [Desulfobacterales bacterium CG23_combo_of_CG06-09_8_20_14_all_51_8]|nr:MAG: hypothetical protein COX19_00140 [Desulfobacterales bacterium CG23_combo_of_CG06-09_8_20_14_all_51_8]